MKRGEVRWYRFSKPDKKRPVLILTRTAVMDYLGQVTIAPITRTIRDIPSEVVLTGADGMPSECAVTCDHLQTVSKNKVGPLITVLSIQRMGEVSESIRFALDL